MKIRLVNSHVHLLNEIEGLCCLGKEAGRNEHWSCFGAVYAWDEIIIEENLIIPVILVELWVIQTIGYNLFQINWILKVSLVIYKIWDANYKQNWTKVSIIGRNVEFSQ